MLFEVETPLGCSVRCTETYWDVITQIKHPVMAGQLEAVRRSKKDAAVLLFYRSTDARWMCAVVRRLNGDGFLITAYPTDSIKSGERIWTR